MVPPPKATFPEPVKLIFTEFVPSDIVICTAFPLLRVELGTITSP